MKKRYFSHNIDREISCGGKKPYETFHMALRAAKALLKHSREKPMDCGGKRGKLTAYKCRYCHRYHIGHDWEKKDT